MEEAVEGIGKRSEEECRREDEKGERKGRRVRRREEGRRRGEGGGGVGENLTHLLLCLPLVKSDGEGKE